MTQRETHLDIFYALLADLARRTDGPRLLSENGCRIGLPDRGVYFFFEPGELRVDGRTPRVVRVGTHAVSRGSRTTLWDRLAQHRGQLDGGNHRGSIFRLHVGTALANSGWAGDVSTWGSKHRPPDEALRWAERLLEQATSAYIQMMPFLWLAVDDPPSKGSDRKIIETNAIALLSNLNRTPPLDPPSAGWLGRRAARSAVRESGLWNVNHVDEDYDPGFLDLLARYVRADGLPARST